MAIVLFDVDGTLIDSFPGIRQSLLTALDMVGVEHPDEDFLSRIAGPPMEKTLQSLGLDEATVKQGLANYLQVYGEVGVHNATAFPGMQELLKHTREKGHLVCTATSKGEHFARVSLERFGMLEEIMILGAAEENGKRRAKDAVIAYVLEQLGDQVEVRELEEDDPRRDSGKRFEVISEQPILMIGDRSHDVEGAHVFGIETCYVAWGYGTPEEAATARYVVETPQELEQLLDQFPH